MDTVREVAEEGRRLIDRAWLGELTREEAVHRFVQVGDGLVCRTTAAEIIDAGVRELDAGAARRRIRLRCALLEVPVLGGFALAALAFGDLVTAAAALTVLGALQLLHRALPPATDRGFARHSP
ncbi:hypothetical protein ACWEKT_21600 [Nocardia takedensis]